MIAVKFGGSLLTDKQGREAFRKEIANRAAAEVAEVWRSKGPFPLLLGHGSGSFGHRAAAGSGVLASTRLADAASLPPLPRTESVSNIQDAAARLHRLFCSRLLGHGLPVFSVAPSSFVVTAGGRPTSLRWRTVELALQDGLIPMVYGDVVLDEERGAVILSTETVFELLFEVDSFCHSGDPTRVVWLGETEGILDRDGSTIDEIDPSAVGEIERLDGGLVGASGVDVTGGIAHRFRCALALADRGIESWLLDGTRPGVIRDAIAGIRRGGTRILARTP